MEKICFDCGEPIDDETLERYPDTEICGDCMYLDSCESDEGGIND